MTRDQLQKSLGARIRNRRESLGITQEQLAGADMTKSFISQIETGKVMPSVWNLIQIAQRLGCTVGYLIGETDDAPAPTLETIARQAGIEPEAAVRFMRLLLERAGEGAE